MKVPFSRVLMLCAVLTFFALGMAGQLFVFKYEGAIGDIRQARMALIGAELEQIIEKGAAIGLLPADTPALRDAIRARLDSDPLVGSIEITDAKGGPLILERRAEVVTLALRSTVEAKNSFGLLLAHVTVTHDGAPLSQQMKAFAYPVLLVGGAMALVFSLLGSAAVVFLRRRGHTDKFSLIGILPWLVVGVLVLGGMTYQRLQTDMLPEFRSQAEAVGKGSVALLARATEQGVALAEVPGIAAYFDRLRLATPAFAEISLIANSAMIAHSGNSGSGPEVALAVPGVAGAQVQLRIRIDPDAVQAVLRNMLLDLLTIIVVSGFLAIELFRFMFVGVRGQGAGSAATEKVGAGVTALRAPVFLLFLAEDLTRSFLPVYAGQLPAGSLLTALGWTLSGKTMAGLPVIVFMLLVALAQPVLGRVVSRAGASRLLLVAALGGALAHGLAAASSSVDALLATRVLAALAWAIVFATAQSVVLANVGREHRASGMAYFVGIIMSASICGPSIGGILADSIGYRATFVTALVLSLVAAVQMRFVKISSSGAAPPLAAATGAVISPLALLANRRFAQLLLLAAIPAKLILIAYCFYLVPVYIGDWGGSAADAGRIQMIYSLAMVLAVPWFARNAVPGRQAVRVAAGLVISGASGLLLLWPNLGTAAAMALVLGVGQSIGIAAQAALVGEVCAEQIKVRGDAEVYGMYRLLERMGNAMGPAVSAALAALLGASGSFAVLGGTVAAGGLLFGHLFKVRWRELLK